MSFIDSQDAECWLNSWIPVEGSPVQAHIHVDSKVSMIQQNGTYSIVEWSEDVAEVPHVPVTIGDIDIISQVLRKHPRRIVKVDPQISE